jgi:hypothetical protein
MRTIHRAGILLNLLREDFRRRIQGVMTPLPQTPIHLVPGAASQRPTNGTPAVAATSSKDRRSSGFSDTASMITEYPAASASAAFRHSVRSTRRDT